MHTEGIVNDLHPNEAARRESHLALEAVDKRRVKLVNEDATKEWIGVEHDDLVAEASYDDLVLLSTQSRLVWLLLGGGSCR